MELKDLVTVVGVAVPAAVAIFANARRPHRLKLSLELLKLSRDAGLDTSALEQHAQAELAAIYGSRGRFTLSLRVSALWAALWQNKFAAVGLVLIGPMILAVGLLMLTSLFGPQGFTTPGIVLSLLLLPYGTAFIAAGFVELRRAYEHELYHLRLAVSLEHDDDATFLSRQHAPPPAPRR